MQRSNLCQPFRNSYWRLCNGSDFTRAVPKDISTLVQFGLHFYILIYLTFLQKYVQMNDQFEIQNGGHKRNSNLPVFALGLWMMEKANSGLGGGEV